MRIERSAQKQWLGTSGRAEADNCAAAIPDSKPAPDWAEPRASAGNGREERNDSVVRQSATKAAKKDLPELPVVDDKAIDFETIERLFFAYRDFVSDPDAILSKFGYGRAHHRVVYFVSRRPGMTVADLLAILQITKQSLARVLKELIDSGYIRQMAGPADRRQRRLYPTLAGRELALALSEPQSQRIANAMQGLSIAEREAVRRFLDGMQKQTVAVNPDIDGAD